MAIAMAIFSIAIVIAICHVPLVVASVEVRATPGLSSAIIGIAVTASQSGAVVGYVAAPNSRSATAFKTAGRTIAAPETWAAAIASASQRGSTAAAAIASASKGSSTATRATAAGAGAGTTTATATATATAATAPTTSAASPALVSKIDKVGVGVGLEVHHRRRIGDRRAQREGSGKSRHRFPIDTHSDLHRNWFTGCPPTGEHCFTP